MAGGGAAGGGGAGIATSILSAIIGGAFDMYQGSQNRAQQQKMHDEEMAMANKQFGWGQTIDRFNMGMTVQDALSKANATQKESLMMALKTHLAMKDRANNLFSSKG